MLGPPPVPSHDNWSDIVNEQSSDVSLSDHPEDPSIDLVPPADVPHSFLPRGLGLDPFTIEIHGFEQSQAVARQVDGRDYLGEIESRTIVISVLDPLAPPKKLHEVASSFGDVAMMTFESHGYVTVRFFDLRAARTMRGCLIVLNGHELSVHYGPQLPIENPKKPPNNGTIVLFHLAPDVQDEMLTEEFGKYGEVRQVRATPHRTNQKFIEFWDSRDAQKAAEEMNGRWIFGTRIAVDFSLPGGCRKMAEPPKVPTIQRKENSTAICLSAAFDRSN
jgi:hypothetical protein